MRTTWTFHTAGEFVFGPGAIERLPEILDRLHTRRLFLVSDPVLVRVGIVDQVLNQCRSPHRVVEVFDGGVPEPPLDLGVTCADRARSFRADCVLGLGGGSNLDLAKLASLLLAHGGTPRDYVGEDRVPGPILPLVCLPTTAGTGSEVSGSAVLTDVENQMKLGILSQHLRPQVALVDPRLTLSCPAQVTADSGIDALTHAIEAFTAVDNEVFPLPSGERTTYQGRHPFGDMLAEKAIQLVGAHLKTAVHDGRNLAAREGMALAATLGGLAFSNVGVAAVHALEYPVGAAVHCSHGAGNGLLLPYVMRFNLPARLPQFAQVAEWLGEPIAGLSVEEAAERSIQAVKQLKSAIGIPTRLRDIGVREEQLALFADKAFAVKRILRVNPISPTRQQLEQILREAY
jgi:alcohol dehydrogenase class IV